MIETYEARQEKIKQLFKQFEIDILVPGQYDLSEIKVGDHFCVAHWVGRYDSSYSCDILKVREITGNKVFCQMWKMHSMMWGVRYDLPWEYCMLDLFEVALYRLPIRFIIEVTEEENAFKEPLT